MTALILTLLLTTDPQTLEGRVVHIADGDTMVILVDKQEIKIRLHGIDAPESGQPWGNQAKERLKELCHGENVTVVTHGQDRYARTIGEVFIHGESVNQTMVKEGLAWQYRQYDKSKALADLEKSARLAHLGLWADDNPIEPWVWRKSQRDAASIRRKTSP